ncbi:MAG TPA: hypothetical protein VEI97_15065 [bacterium]|nr:hypothetical protein [bacterium]
MGSQLLRGRFRGASALEYALLIVLLVVGLVVFFHRFATGGLRFDSQQASGRINADMVRSSQGQEWADF